MGQLVFQATLGGQVNLVGPNTASTFNLNVPAVSSTLATLTGTETFTNKTLTSPTLTTPVLGTPASGTLTNCTSLPVGGITATGTPSSTTYLRGDSTWATISTTTNAITNGTSNVTVNSSGGTITAATAGTTAVTIDTSQNVGIGQTSPNARLEALSSTAGAEISRFEGNYSASGTVNLTNWRRSGGAVASVMRYNDANTDMEFGTTTSHSQAFITGGTERMRIDSSGNVGIGTSSPTQKLQVAGNAFISAGQYFMWDNAGAWSWQSDASTYMRAYTNGNERMRINSSGVVMVGTTTTTPAGSGDTKGISLWTDGSSSQIFSTGNGDTAAVFNRAGSDGALIRTRRQGSDVGSISVTGSATAYNTSSDYRLKNNITPMTGALTKVAQLKPVTYKWNIDGSDGEGFIAHELAEVCPHAVVGEKDALDKDGNPEYQGIDTSFLVATLTAAIQEQQALITAQAETINALTARVVALEAK